MHLPKTLEQCINEFEIVHSYKYDYSLVDYISSKHKVRIICKIHGEFLQTSDAHKSGRGCPHCKSEKISKVKIGNINTFIEKANIIHSNKYNYSEFTYTKSSYKSIIKCPIHGNFNQSPNNHLKGKGCPKCKSSKGELNIRKFLTDNNCLFIEQHTFNDCTNIKTNRKLVFDFYLPEHNICIEFDGEQHYKPKSFGSNQSYDTKINNLKLIQSRDKLKDEYCQNNNIRLIRITYKQIDSIDLLLKFIDIQQ